MKIQRANARSVTKRLYEGDGALTLEIYFADSSALGASLMRYEIPPGAEEGLHLHSAGVEASCSPGSIDELYVVTRGELVMTLEGEEAVLLPGDAVYASAGTRHGIANHSSVPAELIVVYGAPAVSTAE